MVIERLRELAREHNLDGVIATSFENVCYLTQAVIYTQILIPQRLAALVVPVSVGEPTFVVCTIEESFALEESTIEDIRGYEEFNESPLEIFADVAREKGIDAGRIGVEMRVLTAGDLEELRSRLPDATFVAVDDVFDSIRMVKSPEEIERLGEIFLATDKAIRSAYESAYVGATESEVLDVLVDGLMAAGADYLPFLCLGAGPNVFHTHPTAGEYRIAEGDLIACDVGGRFAGYYSDLARTAVIGRATPHQLEMYRNLWEIHERVIARAKPGVRASDLYWLCRDAFEQRNMTLSLSHIGHSIGLGLHERPMICPTDHTELQEGMTLAIEPAARDETGAFHVEDLVEITAEGCRVLSRSADWSELLVIG